MSMLSPAARPIRITVSGCISSTWAMVMILRPSSTSTSSGTSAKSAICSAGLMLCVRDQVDGVLAQLVRGSDHFGIGLVAALEHDEIGEFGGDIDVGRFERAA